MPSFKIDPIKYESLTEKDHHEHHERDSDEITAINTPLSALPFFKNSHRPSRSRSTLLIALAFTILALLSTIQIFLLATPHSITHPPFDESPCGKTVAEAKDRGCHYSFALGDWLHDECYDQELEDEYRTKVSTAFEWYYPNADNTGPDFSKRLKHVDDLANRGFPLITWTNWRYHVDHCMITFMYMHKLALQGRKVSAGLAELEHTRHCMNETLDALNSSSWHQINTGHINGFPPCVELAGYKKTHRWPYAAHGTGYGHH